MKFRQRLSIAVKALTSDSLGNSLGTVLRNYAEPSHFEPARQVTGITYKAIDKIGLLLSIYEPLVKKGDDDYVANHPITKLFNNPNPNVQSGSDFIHMYAMLWEIYGENFIYKAKGESTGRLKEIYLLPPDRIEIKVDQGELVGYILHKSDGNQVPFLPDEIYHDKRPNPFNEWRGMSVLEKAAIYVDTEIVTSDFTLNYIRNSGSPSGIVSLPQMAPETFKQFTQQWRENYEGPKNAGKTAFVRGEEAKFQAVGATLQDIDQKVTRDMAKEDVLMMLEVPRELLGWSKDGGLGRNTYEAAYFVFADAKLEPMMRRLDRIYEHLAAELKPDSSLEASKADVTHQSPVPEDKDHKLKRQKEGTNLWLTINESRALDGLDPLPGGDKLKERTPVAIAPKEDEEEGTKSKRIVLKSSPVKKDITAEQEAFRSKLVETNEVYVTKLKRELSRFAGKQQAIVLDKIDGTSKAYEDWLFEVKEDSEVLAAAMVPIVLALMEAQGKDVANFITGELLTITPEMKAAVEAHIKQIAGVFNADTLAALEKTITEGNVAGESISKLKKRVEQVFQDAKGYRAERIARTESLRTSNTTAEEVYKQNGFSKVAWFVNPSACEFCQTFAGREKSIGSKFVNIGDVVTGAKDGQMRIEYDDIRTPPLHPNCTCSLVPVAD